jgi:hypothetical protein
MVRPKDDIELSISTIFLTFDYTKLISFKVCHGQGASRIATGTLHIFFGDASL